MTPKIATFGTGIEIYKPNYVSNGSNPLKVQFVIGGSVCGEVCVFVAFNRVEFKN